MLSLPTYLNPNHQQWMPNPNLTVALTLKPHSPHRYINMVHTHTLIHECVLTTNTLRSFSSKKLWVTFVCWLRSHCVYCYIRVRKKVDSCFFSSLQAEKSCASPVYIKVSRYCHIGFVTKFSKIPGGSVMYEKWVPIATWFNGFGIV